MKICSKCKELLGLDRFYKAKAGSMGVQGYCKSCAKEMSREYEQKRKGSKERKEYYRNAWQVRKDDPKYQATHAKWLDENKERVKEQAAEYYRINKVYMLVYRSNQNAAKKGVYGTLAAVDWKFILNLTDHKCIACDSSDNITVDHVLPMAMGGLNLIENIQPLCLYCNLKKGKRSVDFRTEEFNQQVRENCP